ncbi:hypothetical protein IW492_00225 [Enterococcus sp. BWB1-3]|uniref:hypothetical protein n=1 Tax=Enterococcus sp. BWB1-3 TaxID=2787713 RepID=UPI001921CC24|nr:hypothetical protein [Enterococcus sp. BWB1-3]MBL1227656.1 hypothetical protein [Enterococcus sp. BWB1-3]
MRKRVFSIYLLLGVFTLIGCGSQYDSTSTTSENAKDMVNSSTIVDEVKVLTLAPSEMSVEELCKVFGYGKTVDLIEDIDTYYSDSDQVVILDSHTILTGSAIIEGTPVDATTDQNSVTIKELKYLLNDKKGEIDSFYEKVK